MHLAEKLLALCANLLSGERRTRPINFVHSYSSLSLPRTEPNFFASRKDLKHDGANAQMKRYEDMNALRFIETFVLGGNEVTEY